MVLWRLDVPEKRDTSEVRGEWVSQWESTLLEAKGRGTGWGAMEGKLGRGDNI